MPISIAPRSTPLRRIGTVLALVACAAFVVSARDGGQTPAAPSTASPKDWIQLFNGKDLTGWTPKFAHHELGENFRDTFRVENGMLEVRYDKWPSFTDEFGHLFYKDPFSYYLLAAEYRFVGQQVPTSRTDLAWALRNNGLMILSPPPKTEARRRRSGR